MRVNDIVEVHDGSYCKSLVKGEMHHLCGNDLRGHRFRVLALSGAYPTDKANTTCGTNDIMLVDTKDPDFVLFTQERFCRTVTPAPLLEKQKELLEVVVPHGIKGVYLTFQK